MIQGLMMHEQLTISQLLDHAAENHGERQIACFAGAQTVRYNYATLRDRVSRLVGVLRRLGVSPGDRVASLAWNSHRHLELYFAVPALGAVLNTINARLPRLTSNSSSSIRAVNFSSMTRPSENLHSMRSANWAVRRSSASRWVK